MCCITLHSPGSTGYKSCYREMLKVVKGVIQEPDDMEDSWIYAFSYYFDHAVEADLVGKEKASFAVIYKPFINGNPETSNSYQSSNYKVGR